MRKKLLFSTVTSTFLILSACTATQDRAEEFSFPILSTQGTQIGTLDIRALSTGGVEIDVDVNGLTPGTHAMHFHEMGACDGPGFKSSGGHYNPTNDPHGHHVGDMMNIEISADSSGHFTVKNMKVNVKAGNLPALMDVDGTALIIHAGADDYTSQPSGAAGPRVACATIPAG